MLRESPKAKRAKPLCTFNSFWDATYTVSQVIFNQSVSFQFLLGCYGKTLKEIQAAFPFQFLLGCYFVGYNAGNGAPRFFQFLLGCYKKNT